MRTCDIEGCNKKHEAKGYCKKHYSSHIRKGSPFKTTLQERFDKYYIPAPESGCWLWMAATSVDGYGQIKNGRSMARAHRVSWELHKGPIPNGLFVCHKCDTPGCVNPDHLFLGTNQENIIDSFQKGRASNKKKPIMEHCICAAIKTTCGQVIRGHRHHDCIATIQANGIGGIGSERGVQGFVTSTGRFVDRLEGYQLQVTASIESIAEGGYRGNSLFSEDLY